MKKIIGLILVFMMLFSGCALLNPTPTPTPTASESPTISPSPSPSASPSAPVVTDYFPFNGNVKMTYEGTGIEYASFVSTVDFIGNNAIQLRTDNGGTVTVTVYALEDGALVKVYAQGETYYQQDFTAERTVHEVVLPKLLTTGAEWTLDDGTPCIITKTDAEVTVPFGSFKALEVTKVYTDSTVREYYAVGFGLIKSEFTAKDDPSFTVVSALSGYEAGGPAVQNIRFYYPDFNNDRLVYVDKALEFYTGDPLIPKIESAFKNPPAGMAPLMSADTAINSIKYDPAAGVVTIDFPATFITKTNAGAGLEGMILESVADTIGGYYQTDKVQITIDGARYESGHFIFNTGEYLPYRPDQAVPYAGA